MEYIENKAVEFIILVNKFILASVDNAISISAITAMSSLILHEVDSSAVQHAKQNVHA